MGSLYLVKKHLRSVYHNGDAISVITRKGFKMNMNNRIYVLGMMIIIITIAGCSVLSTNKDNDTDNEEGILQVISTSPVDLSTGVGINTSISGVFNNSVDFATVVPANFTLTSSDLNVVKGNVIYDSPAKKAIFAPAIILSPNTVYTANLTTNIKDPDGNVMSSNKVWSFTTAGLGSGPAPISLGTAAHYSILSKTGISTVPDSKITGNIGLSPAAESYMTGFSQTKNTGYSISSQITGYMYAADMTPPTPTYMGTAISDMETAYIEAVGRSAPDFLNLLSGNIGGLTMEPGIYKWTSSVTIPSDVTIWGGENDVWIFQISGDLLLSSSFKVLLSGGAQAKNIFWQVAGEVNLGTDSHFEGIILSQTAISLNTGATMNGRALAQTKVILNQATIVESIQ